MNKKSTYSLLLDAAAEEKGHSIFETAVYSLVVLCMALAGWHFASGTVTLPGQNRAPSTTSHSMIAATPAPQPLVASAN
jgi:hypothetical protein